MDEALRGLLDFANRHRDTLVIRRPRVSTGRSQVLLLQRSGDDRSHRTLDGRAGKARTASSVGADQSAP
jgi:hypothetical protein